MGQFEADLRRYDAEQDRIAKLPKPLCFECGNAFVPDNGELCEGCLSRKARRYQSNCIKQHGVAEFIDLYEISNHHATPFIKSLQVALSEAEQCWCEMLEDTNLTNKQKADCYDRMQSAFVTLMSGVEE